MCCWGVGVAAVGERFWDCCSKRTTRSGRRTTGGGVAQLDTVFPGNLWAVISMMNTVPGTPTVLVGWKNKQTILGIGTCSSNGGKLGNEMVCVISWHICFPSSYPNRTLASRSAVFQRRVLMWNFSQDVKVVVDVDYSLVSVTDDSSHSSLVEVVHSDLCILSSMSHYGHQEGKCEVCHVPVCTHLPFLCRGYMWNKIILK